MRQMGLFSQSVHYQDPATLDLFNGIPADELGIGDVGEIPHPVGIYHEFVMHHFDGFDFQAGDPEGMVLYRVEAEFRGSRIAVFGKSVGNGGAQAVECGRVAVNRHRPFLVVVERAHIVQSSHMVAVLVGEQDGVYVFHAGPQHLIAEVGSGIDKDRGLGGADQGRCPEPLVARVGRSADRTMAADDGHALRGSGSQKRQTVHIRVVFPGLVGPGIPLRIYVLFGKSIAERAESVREDGGSGFGNLTA